MIRTQIQLTEAQARVLKRIAKARGVSMAALVREGVDKVLREARREDPAEVRERAKRIIGRYRFGPPDLAERHDDYLDEAYRA